MPNYTKNKIIFDKKYEEDVISVVGMSFNFNDFIPQPYHMYHGNLSSRDHKDFPCNWWDWNNLNWGTKWNCSDYFLKIEDDKVILNFDTAWTAPFPIICAFANKFRIPFEHHYWYDGADDDIWTIHEWKLLDGAMCRIIKD